MTADPPWLEPVKARLLRIMVAPHRRHRFERVQVSCLEDPWLENYKRRFPNHILHPGWHPTYHVTFSVFSPTRATEKATRMLMTELEPHLDRIVFQHWGSIPRWGQPCYEDADGGEWTVAVVLRKEP